MDLEKLGAGPGFTADQVVMRTQALGLLEYTMLFYIAPLPGYPSHLLPLANSCCVLRPSLSVSYLKPALTSLIPPASMCSVGLSLVTSVFLVALCMYLFYIA